MNDAQNITKKASVFITFGDGINATRKNYILEKLTTECIFDRPSRLSGIELLISETDMLLRSHDLDPKASVSICLYRGAANHRRLYGGGKSQQLAKAIGLDLKKDIDVVDATAGLAGDSFVLASLGASVTMLEQSSILALLIDEAILAAKKFGGDQAGLQATLDRMTLFNVDARTWLADQQDDSCAVVYLDPMFPERRKQAAVKKQMQLLYQLLGEAVKTEQDRLTAERELLAIALQKARHRVVVKRPRHAPCLPGIEPGYSLQGKSTRFDIYPMLKIS